MSRWNESRLAVRGSQSGSSSGGDGEEKCKQVKLKRQTANGRRKYTH